jgi:hypothetical protein
MMQELDGYTFLDLGGRGVGVDIDPAKIEKLRGNGFDCMSADATDIDADDNSVKYVTMMHFLEHLPDRTTGEAVIRTAIRLASDFVFMTGPDFECADYLQEKRLRKHYADWSGHPWHHSLIEISAILKEYNFPHCIVQSNMIPDSNHRVVIPLSCSKNHGYYDPEFDPPKEFHTFDRKMYCNLSFFLCKNERFSLEALCVRAQGMLGGRISRASSVFPPLYK